jgi:predicted TIM-barrel fold metal-dependent hydrolase
MRTEMYPYPDKTIIFKPGQKVQFKTGQRLILIVQTPRCIVDSHMHIMNGACTPLPLLWDKSNLIKGWERKFIDGAGVITDWLEKLSFHIIPILGESGSIQVMKTVDIGGRAVCDNKATFALGSKILLSETYKNADFFSIMIAMPMDMEYAHIAGYEGQTIYHTDNSPWYFHRRISGAEPEKNGLRITLPGENRKTFCEWYFQYKDTKNAAKKNPLQLIPMYHYEPRRWRGAKNSNKNELMQTGPWNQPFEEIATAKNKGTFIGFKMYPSLGYQPLDPILTHLWEGGDDSFFGKCAQEKIPILAHCSPGGMTTHEILFYRELHLNKPQIFGNSPIEFKQNFNDSEMPQADKLSGYSADFEKEYFYEQHVHPKAWRKVLDKFRNLKLCLAHFGGELWWKKGVTYHWIKEIISLMNDYDNVYTDFSCHDIKKSGPVFMEFLNNAKSNRIYSRILFGTDWYMTMVALKGKGYQRFCEEYWDLFDDKDLWLRVSFLNPFEFYGFDDESKLKNVYEGIKAENVNDKKNTKKKKKENLVETNYSTLKRLRKEYLYLQNKLGGGQNAQ